MSMLRWGEIQRPIRMIIYCATSSNVTIYTYNGWVAYTWILFSNDMETPTNVNHHTFGVNVYCNTYISRIKYNFGIFESPRQGSTLSLVGIAFW